LQASVVDGEVKDRFPEVCFTSQPRLDAQIVFNVLARVALNPNRAAMAVTWISH